MTNSNSGRLRLLRRLRNLRNLEWFNVPFLVSALLLVWEDRSLPSVWQRLLAYIPVALLLIVGGWYWHRKLHQLRTGAAPDLSPFDRVDRIAPFVLAAATLALFISWLTGTGEASDRAWATGFLVLAWAEYVNYFRVQLMHDTVADLKRLQRTRRLRRSWLAVDLDRWRAAGRPGRFNRR